MTIADSPAGGKRKALSELNIDYKVTKHPASGLRPLDSDLTDH